jgi:NADH-quinone oxidoreductase subunit E
MPSREAPTEAAGAGQPAAGPEVDLEQVGRLVAEIDPHGNLIALLQRAQDVFGYLPEPVVDEIARLSGVPASRIYGIITFYAQFTTVPSGRRKIYVCHGTACHVAGATRITEALEQELEVGEGDTTADMEFTLGSVACMGACSQAPVMRVGEDTYGNLSADETRKIARKLLADVLEARGGDGDA